jgi:outer membrane protein TolC
MSFPVRASILAFSLVAATTLAQQDASANRPETPPTEKTHSESLSDLTKSVPRNPDESRPDAIHLSLDDAITAAIRGNLNVEVQRYDFRMTGYGAKEGYGLFDPLATASLSTSSQKQPVAASILSSSSDQKIANIGVQQFLPTGGSYAINFNNSRQKSNSAFTTVNPAFQSSLGLGLTQPLLRDFGVDVNMRQINIARNTLGISREDFRNALTQTALAVEQAYYDLIFARENLEVKKQSLFLGTDQARITQIRIDVGASAPLDILQPRVAIATREEELIVAEAQVRDAEDRLRQLMNLPQGDWDKPILPSDPITYQPVEVKTDQAVESALKNRPEIRQADLNRANKQITYAYSRNQTLPRLDLKLNYGLAGLGGDRIIRDPVTNQPIGIDRGGYSDALSQVTGIDYPSWTVGFNIGVPVTNIGARSEKKRAELDLQKSGVDEDVLRQSIVVDVRQAVRSVETLAREIVATRAARDAAEQNVEAERKRFENGMTTNFDVLQIQQQLSDARSNELGALVAYNKAVANLHRAEGDLLETRGIAVEEPEHFDLPHSHFESVHWLQYDRNGK